MKTIVIAGTIGKDAVFRRTQGGEPVLGFSVAVDDGYGENKSTMWFDVSLWGKRGEKLEPHLKKGTRVTVSGEFGSRAHEGSTYFTCRASDITIQGGTERKERSAETVKQRVKEHERNSYGVPMDDMDTIPF